MQDGILIVDPSRLVREAFAKILLAQNIEKSLIACVETIDDAIEFIEFSAIELLIIADDSADSLITLEQKLKLLYQNKPIPTLFLNKALESSDTHKEVVQLSALAKQSITLAKPFNQPDILTALFELTQNSHFKNSTKIEAKVIPAKTVSQKNNPDKSTVLVVDDESSNIDVAAGSLRDDYRVIAAKSGQQALKILANDKHSIDLILLDIMMPCMDGFEVCTTIKKQPKTEHIPVIFLSAKTQVDDIKQGFKLGAVDYITKPLNPDLLRARVATHIRLKQHNNALANQINTLEENAKLREDIEKITQHDLKGPLNNILFQTHRLKDKKVAQSINNSVNNVVNMINNSLNMYKIEQGLYQLSPEKVNLTSLISDSLNSVEQLATNKKLTFDLAGLKNEHYMKAEPLLCLSIFNNLIKNAVEASPLHGSVVISVRESNEQVIFSIINQGIIPKDMRDTLFNKYSSSNYSIGTGLGTYSAKLMTEVQHGSINFEVLNEEKTSFSVQMPSFAHLN